MISFGQRTRWVAIGVTLVVTVTVIVVAVLEGTGRRDDDQTGAAATSSPPTTQPSTQPPTQPSTRPAISTSTAGGGATAATRIVTLAGMTEAGTPAAGFTIQDIDATVDGCMTSLAAAGPDIVACAPSAAGADVCWVRPDRIELLCGVLPWDKHLYRLAANALVPPTAAAKDPAPWGLELGNGTRCRLRNGGAWGGRNDDYVGAYWCTAGAGPTGEINVLTNGKDPIVNRSNPTWTVLVGDLGAPGEQFPPPTEMAVTVAYFAGRAT